MSDLSDWIRPELGSGRVLFPPEVDDREWLMGLVYKAACDNLHTNVGAMLANAGQPHARSFDLGQNRPELLDGLSRVLGVSSVRLAPLVNAKIDREGEIPLIEFQGARVAAYDVMTRERRISPRSLAQEPFHRAVWQHRLLPYCPHSGELLLDACPRCGSRLDWFRATDLAGCSAKGCDADLRGHELELLPEAHAGSYRRMAALLAPSDAAAPSPALHPDLAQIETGTVFELGWRLASTLAEKSHPRDQVGQLEPAAILERIRAADDIIAGWPDFYRSSLMLLAERSGAEAARKALSRLRALAKVRPEWPPMSDLIREAFGDLLRRGREALRSLDVHAITGTELQHRVGLKSSTFAALKRASVLPTVSKSGTKNAFHDFDPEFAESFAEAKAGSVSVARVAETLGVPVHGVEQLVVGGLLVEEQHSALSAYMPGLRIRIDSLRGLSKGLRSASTPDLQEGPLLHAVLKGVAGEKPWGPIIAGMLQGRIVFRLSDDSPRLLHPVVLEEQAVDLITSMRFDRHEHAGFDYLADMSKRDLEEALNLKPGYAPAVMMTEMQLSGRFARAPVSEVIRIANDRISAAEILARFGDGGRRLPLALKRSRLQRGPAGWRREDVEALLAPQAK